MDMRKFVFAATAVLAMCTVWGAPQVSDLTVTPVAPWGLALDYTVSEATDAETNAELVVTATDGERTHVARHLSGATNCVNGTHRVYWNMAKDGITVTATNSVVQVEYAAPYCVVDLSGGTNATSYPVSYLSDVPAGGWTDEYKTTKLVLRRVSAGSFIMGDDQADESHRVTLTQPFYVGVFEVTQKQWELVMGTRPSYFSNASCYATRPVESVSYNDIRGRSAETNWPASSAVDATSFLGVLRAKTGMDGFDLPTEAQWEYACRAGTTSTYNNGGDTEADLKELGRYSGNGGSRYSLTCDTAKGTAAVGSYVPNAWGLYDLHGNVLEWCLDWYDAYRLSYGTDPEGSSSGSRRVRRGGGWDDRADDCTSSYRSSDGPSIANYRYGFRLVRTLKNKTEYAGGGPAVAGSAAVSNVSWRAHGESAPITRPLQIDYVPDGNGSAVVSVDGQAVIDSATPGTYTWQPQTNGTYTVEHSGWDGAFTATYIANTPSGGTWLYPSTAVQTHGPNGLDADNRYDFYRISMTAGCAYTFETTGDGNTYGELFSAASTNTQYRVASDDDGGDGNNFKLTYTPTTSGTYYLRVRAYNVGTSLSYTLSYNGVPTVSNLTVTPVAPWGLVLDYTVNGATDAEANVPVSVTATVDGTNYVARHLSGATNCVNGTHRIYWNMAKDGITVTATNSVVQIEYVPLYCVVDLSGGTNATSYPVSYFWTVPAGGWTDEYKTTKLVLRRVSAGSFIMGDDQTNESHRVTISQPFYTGVFEVTQKQWELVMGTRPSYFTNASYYATRPVEKVSYYDIRGSSVGTNWPASSAVDATTSFLGRLRAKTGLDGFDLPTEAQWEYACRAGTTSTYNNGGDTEEDLKTLGRYWGNAGSSYSSTCGTTNGTAAVGSYEPNAWGLYDLHGNVWEWCLDWYDAYRLSYGTDPEGSSSGSYRVGRGGSWSYYADVCTSSYRYYYGSPSGASRLTGFRLVRTLHNKTEYAGGGPAVAGSAAVSNVSWRAHGESTPVTGPLQIDYVPDGSGRAVVSVDGQAVVDSATRGTYVWQPQTNGTHTVEHSGWGGAFTATYIANTPSGGTWLYPSTAVQTHGPNGLDAGNRYDFYRISMTAGCAYTFETTGDGDTYGELFSAASTNASCRVASDDNGGDGNNFKLTYTPTTSGTYYLRVRAYNVGTSLSYTLSYKGAAVSNLTVTPVAPWGVVIDYTVGGVTDAEANVPVSVTATVDGTNYVARHLSGATNCVNGTHRIYWNMAKDGITVTATNSVVQVEYAAPYCVVDLSGGTNATSYPVSYLSDVPAGGWTDEHKTTKLVLRRIPAGSFIMGDDQTDESHRVTLTQPFYTGVFEVTQKQWELVMGTKPSYFSNASCYATRPVERVSYNDIRGLSDGAGWPASSAVDATSFLGRLRAKTGLDGFDLPTEAQWEYACRAGTTSTYNNGGDAEEDPETLGRYWGNGGSGYRSTCGTANGTAAVGSYEPNAWGLYDMHGNVWEWCLDWYGSLGYGADPVGSSSGSYRVLRGGGWSNDAGHCTSSYRYNDYPSDANYNFGFRLVRTLKNKTEYAGGGPAVAGSAAVSNVSWRAHGESTPVTGSLQIDYVPDGSGRAVVSVDGQAVVDSTTTGTYTWQPQSNGARTVAHSGWGGAFTATYIANTPSGGTWLYPSTAVQTHGPNGLDAGNRYDFYRISMTAGCAYTFETTGDGNTYGELFSAASTNASYRVASDDDGGDGNNFKLTYTPSVSGTYYLRVRAYNVGTSLSYTLSYKGAADGVPTVSNLTVTPVAPWGLVLDYTVSGATDSEANVPVSVTATADGTNYVARHLSGATNCVNGSHRIYWNMAKDGITATVADSEVTVVYGLYCVVDLSGGTNATSYPVSYLSDVPAGGWTDEYKTTKLVLRRVSAGSFIMGDDQTNELHRVTISQPFYTGVFEVTQKQWELVMGTRPSYFTNASYYATRPVERVSYNDIRGSSDGAGWPASSAVDATTSFLGRLRAKTGLEDFDLPTEAQWEYACRAGTTSTYNNGGDTEEDLKTLGRYRDNGGSGSSSSCGTTNGTAAVGSYEPNAWGLYDLHGNVYEWCLDWSGTLGYGADPMGADPMGSSSGSYRVLRGGSWGSGADGCTSSYRNRSYPSYAYNNCGFRLVSTLKNKTEYAGGGPAVAGSAAVSNVSWRAHGESAPITRPLQIDYVPDGNGRAVVSVDGQAVIDSATSGTYVWQPQTNGTYTVEHSGWGGAFTATYIACDGLSTGDYGHMDSVDGRTWEYQVENDGSAKVTGVSSATGEIEIPSNLNGRRVTSIGSSAFSGCRGLTSVAIPAGVTSIGSYAFKGCSGLKEVVFVGNAPTGVDDDTFPSSATVYVHPGSTGWGVAIPGTWKGVPIRYTVAPTVEGDADATVTGDAEAGYIVTPSATNRNVEVTIPDGVAATNVTVVVGPDVATVRPNGANVVVKSYGHDITAFLDIPAAVDGVVNLASATVKAEYANEPLDVKKGAEIHLDNPSKPSLKTAPTREGLVYTLREGATLDAMKDGDSTVGDGRSWTPTLTVKGGASGFYSIRVDK